MAAPTCADSSAAARRIVLGRLQDSVALQHSLLNDPAYLEAVAATGWAVAQALSQGGKVLFFGNGGSAADAQHLAAEFTGRFMLERRPLPAMALTVNTSSLTAIGNDYSFDTVFSRQVEAFGKPGDVAVGISTSGNSPNVLRALEIARKREMITVGLTGRGGELPALVDHCICIPSHSTPRIQETHILTGHIICEIVEQQLFAHSGAACDSTCEK